MVAQREAIVNVFPHVEPWEELVLLKDHSPVRSGSLNRLSFGQHLAGGASFESARDVQECGFATA
ncbi:MAG: hypothetical protein BWY82_02162 [Verrucomicrobia bacterium ADurb.Bin474]|nr:MAG: hypothetical protein BWY82_02162 [Verrucomicrobia bacterium ADurb.Bin474]